MAAIWDLKAVVQLIDDIEDTLVGVASDALKYRLSDYRVSLSSFFLINQLVAVCWIRSCANRNMIRLS